jgi:hypothetical protein
MTATVLKAMTIPAATLVVAIALGRLFAPAAVRAGEYYSEDGYISRGAAGSARWSNARRRYPASTPRASAILSSRTTRSRRSTTTRTRICSAVPSRAHRKRRSRPPRPTSRAKHSDAVSKITTLEATKSKKSSGVSRSDRLFVLELSGDRIHLMNPDGSDRRHGGGCGGRSTSIGPTWVSPTSTTARSRSFSSQSAICCIPAAFGILRSPLRTDRIESLPHAPTYCSARSRLHVRSRSRTQREQI